MTRRVIERGEYGGVSYEIELEVWPDGATIEEVRIVGGTSGYFSGAVFVSQEAALAAGLVIVNNLTGGDPLVTVDGIKPG